MIFGPILPHHPRVMIPRCLDKISMMTKIIGTIYWKKINFNAGKTSDPRVSSMIN
jgi:hypothetical protein